MRITPELPEYPKLAEEVFMLLLDNKLRSQAEIIKFLKDSFALGHRAAATLTAENMLQTAGNGKSTRLRLATFGVAHAYDHYGQMVEYLRMNGIVPPASRRKSD